MSALSEIHAVCYEVFDNAGGYPVATAIVTVQNQYPDLTAEQVTNLVTGFRDMWVKDRVLTPVIV